MIYIRIALAMVCAIGAVIGWNIVRRDYRQFEREFNVKLPFLCYVNKRPKKDAVAWGFRRYRHIRKDGQRDRRYALNFKVTYPTIITCCQYRVRIWNMEQARSIFQDVQDYMWLQTKDLGFYGNIEGSLWKFFHGKRVRFVRYIAKLMELYGWFPTLLYDSEWDIMLERRNSYYAVKCIFKNAPVVLEDVMHIGKLVDIVHPVIVTNGIFSEGAYGYCRRHHIEMMDRKRIKMSLELGFLMFIGRQA